MPTLIPDEEARKKLFHWLTKASSYTAYERIGRYYKAWVDQFERLYRETQRNPDPEHGVLLADDKYVSILSGYAVFEEGLARLKKGNKRPFVWLGQTGHFSEAGRVVDYWAQATDKGEYGDIELKPMYSPLWPAVKQAHSDLLTVWGESAPVEQLQFTDRPAPVGIVEDADRCRFPDAPLADVPVPEQTVLVQTGSVVSAFGIWEPVKADMSSGFIGMFQKPKVPANGSLDVDGCMNYLHQGAAAPTTYAENDGQRGEGRPTVWRLLWEDTRYADGRVPAEERDYVFVDPSPAIDAAINIAQPAAADPLIRAMSGEVASRSGTWAVMDDIHGRMDLKAGERLPRYQEREVQWVWVNP